MMCVVYKGKKRSETYLYVERDGDFSRVPPALLQMLGALERVMELDLNAQRKLANVDVDVLKQRLAQDGYYLQMPPQPWPVTKHH